MATPPTGGPPQACRCFNAAALANAHHGRRIAALVGWFGFNSGSNLESNAGAVAAMANTFVATAAAGLSWMVVEWLFKGKPSLLGLASGVVAGLVAVAPASG